MDKSIAIIERIGGQKVEILTAIRNPEGDQVGIMQGRIARSLLNAIQATYDGYLVRETFLMNYKVDHFRAEVERYIADFVARGFITIVVIDGRTCYTTTSEIDNYFCVTDWQ